MICSRSLTWIIEPYKIEDFSSLWELERSSGSRRISEEFLARELKGSQTMVKVAKVNHSLVGAVISWNLKDEIQIVELVVLEQWRRQGIGHALLQSLLMGASYATLEVSSVNEAAQKLYSECGFIETGRRPNFYDNREDGIMMEWKKKIVL